MNEQIQDALPLNNSVKEKKLDYSYLKNFKYKHRNPYDGLLGDFKNFVLRDHEGEAFSGHWNNRVFNREAPLCLEIGAGYGHFMQDYCKKNPDKNFVGLDYRFKRSFNLAKKLQAAGENLDSDQLSFRYLRAKGERINFLFGESELSKIFYFFPDPWPKKRHHKKRLFGPPFLSAVYNVLAPGGELYIKTDHDELFEHMNGVILKEKGLEIVMKSFDLKEEFPDHFLAKNETKFEKIFLKQNIKIKAIVLRSLKK